MRSFIGYGGYYCQFIEKFSKITFPLLFAKDTEFYWDVNFQIVYEKLTQKVSRTPMLRGLD